MQLIAHVLHARRTHHLHLWRRGGEFQLDLGVIELALAQALAEHLAGGAVLVLSLGARFAEIARRRQQDVEHPLFGRIVGFGLDAQHRLFAGQLDRDIGQLANDRIDVAAHVANFGELGRLDLDEWRVGELRQAAGDLGLADTGRADHQDVLRRDLGADRFRRLLAAPAIAQRDGDRFLGGGLADDMAIEFGDDLAWRHRSGTGEAGLQGIGGKGVVHGGVTHWPPPLSVVRAGGRRSMVSIVRLWLV